MSNRKGSEQLFSLESVVSHLLIGYTHWHLALGNPNIDQNTQAKLRGSSNQGLVAGAGGFSLVGHDKTCTTCVIAILAKK